MKMEVAVWESRPAPVRMALLVLVVKQVSLKMDCWFLLSFFFSIFVAGLFF